MRFHQDSIGNKTSPGSDRSISADLSELPHHGPKETFVPHVKEEEVSAKGRKPVISEQRAGGDKN